MPSRHRLVSSINHSARFVGELFINHRAKHPDCRDFQKYLENSTKSILAGRIKAVLRNPLTKSVRNTVTLSVERFELHCARPSETDSFEVRIKEKGTKHVASSRIVIEVEELLVAESLSSQDGSFVSVSCQRG